MKNKILCDVELIDIGPRASAEKHPRGAIFFWRHFWQSLKVRRLEAWRQGTQRLEIFQLFFIKRTHFSAHFDLKFGFETTFWITDTP